MTSGTSRGLISHLPETDPRGGASFSGGVLSVEFQSMRVWH